MHRRRTGILLSMMMALLAVACPLSAHAKHGNHHSSNWQGNYSNNCGSFNKIGKYKHSQKHRLKHKSKWNKRQTKRWSKEFKHNGQRNRRGFTNSSWNNGFNDRRNWSSNNWNLNRGFNLNNRGVGILGSSYRVGGHPVHGYNHPGQGAYHPVYGVQNTGVNGSLSNLVYNLF